MSPRGGLPHLIPTGIFDGWCYKQIADVAFAEFFFIHDFIRNNDFWLKIFGRPVCLTFDVESFYPKKPREIPTHLSIEGHKIAAF